MTYRTNEVKRAAVTFKRIGTTREGAVFATLAVVIFVIAFAIPVSRGFSAASIAVAIMIFFAGLLFTTALWIGYNRHSADRDHEELLVVGDTVLYTYREVGPQLKKPRYHFVRVEIDNCSIAYDPDSYEYVFSGDVFNSKNKCLGELRLGNYFGGGFDKTIKGLMERDSVPKAA